MTPQALAEIIGSLPADKRTEVEDFVQFVAHRLPPEAGAKRLPDGLLARIDGRREELRRERGLFDTLPIIREFRETGGRGAR